MNIKKMQLKNGVTLLLYTAAGSKNGVFLLAAR